MRESMPVLLLLWALFMGGAAHALDGVQEPSSHLEKERKDRAAESKEFRNDKERRIGRVHEKVNMQRKKEIEDSVDARSPYSNYLHFKHWLAQYGITAQIAPTLLNQWGAPKGGKPAFQWIISPSVNWNAFESHEIGNGSFQFSYTYNRYGNQQSGVSLTNRLKANTPVNDTPFNNYTFNQLTYTHVFPGQLFQLSVGQFPISNFDNNQYAANQQTNFVNYALSQNASQAYVPDSLGAYVQLNPTQTLSLAIGFQDANNISGNRIQFSTAAQGQYAWFAYAQWKPKIAGLGSSQYSILYYQQPKVPLQNESSQGFSFNAVQNIDQRWGLFMRANMATGAIAPIEASLAGGLIVNNPLGGSRGDQWGIGLAYNKTNKAYFPLQYVRDGELVAESYLNIIAAKVFQIGPSVQIIFNPALAPDAPTAAIVTLRASGLF